MLKDHIANYYYDQNYNCAEALLHAANDYYDLGLDEKSMKLVSGFGAGMQTGNVCGCVLSAISVLSQKYIETKAHESETIKPMVESFIKKFQAELNGSLLCCDLKPSCFQPEKRCIYTVNAACDVLEYVLKQ